MHCSFWDRVWRWGASEGGVCRCLRDRQWEGQGGGETVKEKQRAGLFTWDSSPNPLRGEARRPGMMLEFTEEHLEGR